MKKLAEALARLLVDHPDEVHVTEHPFDGGVELDLSVHPQDRGQVIGKKGRTAAALRDIMDAVGRRQGTEVDLEVVD